MINDAKLVVSFIFENIWLLFVGWHIPGTNVSPAGAAFFFLSAFIALRFVLCLGGTSEK